MLMPQSTKCVNCAWSTLESINLGRMTYAKNRSYREYINSIYGIFAAQFSMSKWRSQKKKKG
jgi:hypothetical protein